MHQSACNVLRKPKKSLDAEIVHRSYEKNQKLIGLVASQLLQTYTG